ncbi:MAG: hypothetical protein IAE79_02850 [Anaerolinea sp.]|nr:hypothetical protein [Anaerolinea sp.]
MKTIDQLRVILAIPDEDKRKASAIEYWNTLSEAEQDEVRTYVQAIVETVRTAFLPLVDVLREFAEGVVDYWVEKIEANLELREYLNYLQKEKGDDYHNNQ